MRRLLSVLPVLLAGAALADSPRVIAAQATREGPAWRIEVTISHPDSGWDHFANAWEVLAPDGTVLGTRELAHPHVDEQPFTRSLSGVVLPEGVTTIAIRARCNLDGWTGPIFSLDLPGS